MFAIIGIVDNVQDWQAKGMAHSLRLKRGIASVQPAAASPRLLLLNYDEKRTSRKEILRQLGKSGWQARLAGC
jgi:hypothetical protein